MFDNITDNMKERFHRRSLANTFFPATLLTEKFSSY